MVKVEVIDRKGDVWTLLILPVFHKGPKGLVEAGAMVDDPPLANYSWIPLPVFTDWWAE